MMPSAQTLIFSSLTGSPLFEVSLGCHLPLGPVFLSRYLTVAWAQTWLSWAQTWPQYSYGKQEDQLSAFCP